jgi:peptide/nickel transport system substrate-binding protein
MMAQAIAVHRYGVECPPEEAVQQEEWVMWNKIGGIEVPRRTVLKGVVTGGAALLIGSVPGLRAMAQDRASTLVIAAPSTPLSLDVENSLNLATIDTISAFYDYLVDFDYIPDPDVAGVMRENIVVDPSKPGGYSMQPRLAESWEVGSDGRSIRFHLRQGVKSNWGNEFTAEDVKYTFDRKFEVKGAGAFMTGVMGLANKDQVKVEGKYTVSFNIDKPNPILLIVSGHLANPIFDAKKCREMATSDDPWSKGFLDTNVAGFGPYDLKTIDRGQQMTCIARADYYGGKPAMETVIFREVPSSATRLSLVRGGTVDIALYLQPVDYASLRDDPNVQVIATKASQMLWIALNAKFEPFDDPLVRQAMNYAFPRNDVLSSILQGFATPQKAVMPLVYPGATDKYWQYDTDIGKAKELLAKAGLSGGFKTTLSYNAADLAQEAIGIVYKSALSNIGVDLTLNKMPSGVFFNAAAKRTEPMFFQLDAPFTPDAGFSANLYFKSTSFINFSNYVSQAVDEQIDIMMSTLDNATRMKAADAAQSIIMSEAPWVFIAFTGYQLAMNKSLAGFVYRTTNGIRFQDFRRA